MTNLGCVWVQGGRSDWVEEGDTYLDGDVNDLVNLRFKADDSDMSDVEVAATVDEEFEAGHVCVGDLVENPHVKRRGLVTKDVTGDSYLPARRLFTGRGRAVESD